MIELMMDILIDTYYTNTEPAQTPTAKVIQAPADITARYTEAKKSMMIIKKSTQTLADKRQLAIKAYSQQKITRQELQLLLIDTQDKFNKTQQLKQAVTEEYNAAKEGEEIAKTTMNIIHSPLLAAGAVIGTVTPTPITLALVGYAAYEIYESDSGDYYAHIIADNTIGAYYEILDFITS